ncbi:hypothetical protein [Actinomadura opuntiae]|uniref:hypothetical protein n=1 Tax=Actinomadura sp. OS1-43 TaxID=604315 RepID=UPI00255AE6EA|nr:hypothetical protein [Actinomadura sp. OS1-43]MDL4818771.1 hypothetical protein [Actinomadura sp. OS1-43]
MSLLPPARVLALAVAGLGASALLAAPAHAAAPSDPADQPTYTCRMQLPAPLIYPPVVIGADCDAANGAPEDGDYNGTVRFEFTDPRFYPPTWDCRRSSVRGDIHDPDDGRVLGADCSVVQPEE